MAWYKTGTISVTNGSTTVTGSGTSWIAGAGIGEALYAPDGRIYEIANISSDTSLTLGSAYLGSNQSGQSYTIIPSQSYIRDLAADASNLISQYASIASGAGAGKFTDGSAATPGIAFSSDVDTGIYRASTNTLGIAAGGVSQMTVNTSGANIPVISNNPTLSSGTVNGVLYLNGSKAVSSGSGLVFDGSNLGLGVAPSAWGGVKAFELSAGASIVGQTFNPTLVGNAYYNGTNWIYRTSGRATKYEPNVGGDGVHSWYTAPSGTAGNPISFTQAMTLDASGKLSLGATSGLRTVNVRNNSTASTDMTLQSNSFNGSTGYATLYFGNLNNDAKGYVNYDTLNSFMSFGTEGTERARIDSSGSLYIGRTSILGVGSKVAVESGGNGIHTNTPNNSSAIAFHINNTQVGNIFVAGSTTAYNTSSDYRLKHDIAPMQGALARVQQLKPVTYKWNADNSDGEGFIAHELAEVCPQAVTGEKDAVDADGKPVYQGIDTSFLVATLTAAIQEQQAIITELRSRIEALESI